ncbi:MAG: L-histidine N(alpha)-methyltransferase [Candidatus Kariarchaeaceae archaeon]
MVANYIKLKQEDEETALARFAKDIFLGFMRSEKVIPSKYMYDTEGSKIYEEIMKLDDYYLVKAEYSSLSNSKEELCKVCSGKKLNLIELGAGNGYKTRILINQLLEFNIDLQYTPVDISEGAMIELVDTLSKEIPNLKTTGIVGEYFDAMEYLQDNREEGVTNLVLFLGSNIGNFDFDDAVDFIFSLWRSLQIGDFVLMGFDLRKNIEQMINAYNDKQGVTGRFNINVLTRINRELGGEFEINKFQHYEPYNVRTGAMESYLISLEDQDVYISKFDRSFHFKKWEPIFMEHSYKYSIDDIVNLAKITSFRVEGFYYDDKKYFVNSLWCVKPKEEISDR